jgi:hypothetical protein
MERAHATGPLVTSTVGSIGTDDPLCVGLSTDMLRHRQGRGADDGWLDNDGGQLEQLLGGRYGRSRQEDPGFWTGGRSGVARRHTSSPTGTRTQTQKPATAAPETTSTR